ncbi:MAG: MarR family transcriptional regulator [Thermomicrobiales bacterium]
MSDTRDQLLSDVALLFSRSTRVLDPIRLQVWDHLGIALPQLRILFRVRASPGIDLRGLAAELRISPSAASQQVDKLVERRLLERRPDERDRRRLQLELTDLGTAATRAISGAAIEYVVSLLSEFSDDDLATFHHVLEVVLQAASEAPLPSLVQLDESELQSLHLRR